MPFQALDRRNSEKSSEPGRLCRRPKRLHGKVKAFWGGVFMKSLSSSLSTAKNIRLPEPSESIMAKVLLGVSVTLAWPILTCCKYVLSHSWRTRCCACHSEKLLTHILVHCDPFFSSCFFNILSWHHYCHVWPLAAFPNRFTVLSEIPMPSTVAASLCSLFFL